jgi:hypothetical protein
MQNGIDRLEPFICRGLFLQDWVNGEPRMDEPKTVFVQPEAMQTLETAGLSKSEFDQSLNRALGEFVREGGDVRLVAGGLLPVLLTRS